MATDDPITVQDEISKLPRGKDGTTIVGGKLCHSSVGQYVSCRLLNLKLWFVLDDII